MLKQFPTYEKIPEEEFNVLQRMIVNDAQATDSKEFWKNQ